MTGARIAKTLRAATDGRLQPLVTRRPPPTLPSAPSTSPFMNGLAIGALVGAVIAGSTIWERRRSHNSRVAEVAGERDHDSA